MAMRFIQIAGRPILIGSVYLRRKVQTTQRTMLRRRSTRSSTGEQRLGCTAEALEPTMFPSDLLLQFPVFGAR